jgi:hypothetical protein
MTHIKQTVQHAVYLRRVADNVLRVEYPVPNLTTIAYVLGYVVTREGAHDVSTAAGPNVEGSLSR